MLLCLPLPGDGGSSGFRVSGQFRVVQNYPGPFLGICGMGRGCRNWGSRLVPVMLEATIQDLENVKVLGLLFGNSG